jgi:hypothetical protein
MSTTHDGGTDVADGEVREESENCGPTVMLYATINEPAVVRRDKGASSADFCQ